MGQDRSERIGALAARGWNEGERAMERPASRDVAQIQNGR